MDLPTLGIDGITQRLSAQLELTRKDRRKPAKKLTPGGAFALHVSDVTVGKLKAALEIATEIRMLVQARYRDAVPLSEDADERARGIRTTEVGGFSVRITPVSGSERFSLTDYRQAGHEVTPAMQEAISLSKPYDRWTTKDRRGPRRADAVELGAAS